MDEIIILSEKKNWHDLLRRHSIKDVYLQYEYVCSMAQHTGARPIILDYSNSTGGFVYSLLVADIAKDPKFEGYIPNDYYYDAETPYGYGGPFFYGEFSIEPDSIANIRSTLYESLKERKITSQFIRFHPFTFIDGQSNVIVDKYGSYKSTIFMDLSDKDIIIGNLDPQYRRKIRKAREASITIAYDKGENIKDFILLYNETMDLHNASDMYYFKKSYYSSLIKYFSNNLIIFYAKLNGKTMAASIFLYDNNYMHFHLGGRDINAPNIPFDNLLMVEAALWGYEQGLKKLHIGGGLSDNDSLFQYKKKFNRNGMLPFYIGRSIIDQDKYDTLMNIRAKTDASFDPDNNYYIQYRF